MCHHPVELMQSVVKPMAHLRVPVLQTSTEILMMAADLSVSLIAIAQQIVPVLDLNVLIHVWELVVKMQFVKLLIICHRAHA